MKVSCICTNRADAFVIERAKKYDIPVPVFSRDDFYQSGKVLELSERQIRSTGSSWPGFFGLFRRI